LTVLPKTKNINFAPESSYQAKPAQPAHVIRASNEREKIRRVRILPVPYRPMRGELAPPVTLELRADRAFQQHHGVNSGSHSRPNGQK
jgi:putative SOS response-associated peptidase YedK